MNDVAHIIKEAERAGTELPFAADLASIRALSTVLPGSLPLRVNGIRVAASVRPRKFVIEGGDETPVTMPRTAFQVVYPDCTVMIDSGLDKATHDSFSPDKPEPYFPEAFAKLQRALDAARLIVLTHFHADHVAGVVCAPNFRELAHKTVITNETAACLMNTPHRLPLAPRRRRRSSQLSGSTTTLISCRSRHRVDQITGQQCGLQMVFIRLQSRQRDPAQRRSGWVLDNILQVKGKRRALGEGRRAGDHGPVALAQTGLRRRNKRHDPGHPR